jgi:hypothetical protein
MFLHPRYDSNMSKSQRAAALEDEAKLWTSSFVRIREFL